MTAGRARLFVALDLPPQLRTRLAGWAQTSVGADERLRLVPAANLHVTLCFLGSRDEALLGCLAQVPVACARAVGNLSLSSAVWLPAKRPRVLAVDLVDGEGELAGLQRRVAEALVARAAYTPERRPYRPHVTVARVRPPGCAPRPAVPPPSPATFSGAALTLYRSRPGEGGPRYEPIATARL